jgi:hypothetical protein
MKRVIAGAKIMFLFILVKLGGDREKYKQIKANNRVRNTLRNGKL